MMPVLNLALDTHNVRLIGKGEKFPLPVNECFTGHF